MGYVFLFREMGFDFKNDLKPRTISFEENSNLTEKLKNSVFYYKSPNDTNTSFYLITSELGTDDLQELRKYIWNKDDAHIIFYYSQNKERVKMIYAKFPPTYSNKKSILEVFSASPKDIHKIENIQRWQFDSGSFWLNYREFLVNSKYKGIDKELVTTLKALKEQLSVVLIKIIPNKKEHSRVVQALIDRTLYIKYLEDNHIINSYFYSHYFQDKTLNYKKLLEENSKADINELYHHIHKIFNNSLFDTPKINEDYLTKEVCSLIASSFESNLENDQLRLFDFKFDVLPIEFISYIYEVFLSEKQKENGIYYTPRKLAQLIVDDVIKEDEIAPLLDPSCGSGMFLITGYQKFLEIAQKQKLEPEDNIEKIRFRIRLLSENIFGIEKEETAQRFTFFSLSLQVFKGINPQEIKEFIAQQLKENKKINLFREYSFFENIKHANTLSVSDKPFEGKMFSYIVGNPPFFRIKNTEEFKTETMFLNSQVSISEDKTKSVKDIVGRHQISQCFFIKIKDWSDKNTRFGFVSNSSNFYNDDSKTFREYFYSQYGIEKLYELSRVKKILFEKAKESVVAVIFSNNFNENEIDYYPVDLGVFSEKPFELLIIQEDKVLEISQRKLLEGKIRLRDFLVGNLYDNVLIEKLNRHIPLENYIYKKEGNHFIHRGLEVVGFEQIEKEFNLKKEKWDSLNKKQRDEYYLRFKNIYFSSIQTKEFPIPFVRSRNIEKFKINSLDSYLGQDVSMFHRHRKKEVYLGNRIIWSRLGNSLKAVYLKDFIYYDFDIYVLKLKKEELYPLITGILNSNLIDFFSNIHLRKRIDGSFPKIGIKDIRKIPISREFDNFLVQKISQLSEKLSNGNIKYSEVKEELNELIYDLYELSYWERQRVKDYFLEKKSITKKANALEEYKNTIQEFLSFYVETPIVIEKSSSGFNLIVVKISFDGSSRSPSSNRTLMYMLNEIFEQNPEANFMLSQEKIFGKNCVYIVKEATNINWTETRAYEDGQDILKHLIPNENE